MSNRDVQHLKVDVPERQPGDRSPSPRTKKRQRRLDEDLPVTFADVSLAKYRISDDILVTACDLSHGLSETLGCDLYLKREYQHKTGSFKERGARNALLSLDAEQRKRGVIAASAGNHALGLSYHGKLLNIPVTVVMPVTAPLSKSERCKTFGAKVIPHGAHIGEAKVLAMDICDREGLAYINGYDDPEIIAGQGTCGMEILSQVKDVDAVVVPIGGGGLIAGIALAVKSIAPHVHVIGVEPENCASYCAALDAGYPVSVETRPTLADGLAVPQVGANAFAVARTYVDKVVRVGEKDLAIAILRLLEVENCVVEGSGAAGIAALLAGQLPDLKGKRVVTPLCGGNIDVAVLGRCIERGLAADGRLIQMKINVSDRPGGIASLTSVLARENASIRDIFHERAWLYTDVFSVRVKVVLEVTGPEHAKHVFETLKAEGFARVDMIPIRP